MDALTALGATEIDVDSLVIGMLRDHAAAKRIDWRRAILAADAAGPTGDRWSKLVAAVHDAVAPARGRLLSGAEHVLLTNPGLLARYDLLDLVDELRERTTRRPEPGQTLRTVWVLVPADDPDARPTLAGKAVPVTTGAEHLALADAWAKNIHRTTASVGAAR